ncbi:hypothetical protein [Streptomyces canus]|uniref:aromatic-ring hydroxylase C-terminal domain-containing protein n=1 Tax=Streptomyces canus TaxID=58343 RepID=UPI0037D9E24B
MARTSGSGRPRRRRHRGDPVWSADLPPEGRGLLLDLVDRAEVRDAAAAWTGRVSSVTARTDRVASTRRSSGPTAVSPGPCPPG